MSLEHVDVLIVGAGLSGIGAGYHLQLKCPTKTYAILEARDSIGGTWDLFRYPGVRSDSDMYTLGYSFRPWTGRKSIADGPSILEYIRQTATEFGIDRNIRFGHRVLGAVWSSDASLWTVEVQRGHATEVVQITCSFLYICSGYYDYAQGYSPTFPGVERFAGDIVHPQSWGADLDYSGKRVVVIGSGATAITIVPAIAESAAHVTMVQRSPSYIVSIPDREIMADVLRYMLPNRVVYKLIRWKNVAGFELIYLACKRWPSLMRKLQQLDVRIKLGWRYNLWPDFVPRYAPFDQRPCLTPNGNLFKAIRQGRASLVTDEIETFTETGLRLRSGSEIEADLIVTATGLNIRALGGLELTVDGIPVDVAKARVYKGSMLSDVPNLAFAMGATNAPFTLKCDLTSVYVCRLIRYMDKHGYLYCTPGDFDPSMPESPLIDFDAGYVRRAIDILPKQGSQVPWRLFENYPRDLMLLKWGSLRDDAISFGPASTVADSADPSLVTTYPDRGRTPGRSA